jgi:hypothetical protein
VVNGEKPPVLAAYRARWRVDVGVVFNGVSATSSVADLARIAPNHPVFRLTMTSN